MISIITVTYNSAEYLSKTIESIKNQSYSDIEYIIIDGGSVDGTIGIIKKYRNLISYWVSEPDDGIYHAMNKGIKEANGDIIGIINSDDWLEPEAIEKVVNEAKTIEKEEFIIHGKVATYDAKGDFVAIRRPKFFPGYYLFSTPFKHPATFVSKKTYERLGLFNIDCGLAADYDFMIRSINNNIYCSYIDDVLTNMRLVGITSGGYQHTNLSQRYIILKNNNINIIFRIISTCGRVVLKIRKYIFSKMYK